MSEQKVYKTLEVTFVVIVVGLLVPGLIDMRNGNRAHRTYWKPGYLESRSDPQA